MKYIYKILKGILIGLGGILPGVSGGMIAASFNVYKELIEALDGLTKTPIKAIISVWEYVLGIAIGVLLGILLIATVFVRFPIPITMLFIGLILGGIPETTNELKGKKLNWKHYLTMAIMMGVMIGLLFLNNIAVVDLGFFQYILTGFLIAISLIIPGLSGTMILLAIGIYDFIMVDVISAFIEAVATFDFSLILELSPPIITIGLSGLISLILLAKPLAYLLKNKDSYFNIAVLGILIVSPFNIMWSLYQDDKYTDKFSSIGIWTVLISIMLFVIGGYLAFKMAKLSNKGDEIENDG